MSDHWVQRIQPRLEDVRERIAGAAARAHRTVDSVRIVAISKGQPLEAIQAAGSLGLELIGENRVEEALEKQAALRDLDLSWHMVGHIQSRKARQIPGRFDCVHSIDRLKIAERISESAVGLGVCTPVLLECNVSGEQSKSGWQLAERVTWAKVVEEFKVISHLPGLELRGLMTMAPWVQDEQPLRSTFRRLREVRDFLESRLGQPLTELSMGMTDDYEFAVEEGATMLRLGRALFGPRL